MRNLRRGNRPPEMWDAKDVLTYQNCDRATAEQIMEECRKLNSIKGYGPIEKHLVLNFIDQRGRVEREREARYQADLATIENISVLKKQLKQTELAARRANLIAVFAVLIAIIDLIVKII